MGYIAPVNMEQTNQYQLRTLQNVVHPITWERIYHVKLHEQLAKHQSMDDIYQRKEQLRKQLDQGEKNKPQQNSVIVTERAKVKKRKDTSFPEITGKGKFISDSV
ncbi:hypothetical protein ACFFJI_12340 [Allobacillus sp. GCM10007491]|uniref:Uncharacterized protein n=1 Tax=Allobacillus saliphilus TaxID=2912308 RepID=A0A941HTM3_9BACI|nr:hypothetical protein [Allobacillus saliphilus]MBR7554573.1 hypothetical protein [Allobacillus saliphilus]